MFFSILIVDLFYLLTSAYPRVDDLNKEVRMSSVTWCFKAFAVPFSYSFSTPLAFHS